VAKAAKAFVSLLEAVAEKPKSQNEANNHHNEDEDLCSFTHITHFFFFSKIWAWKLWIRDGYWERLDSFSSFFFMALWGVEDEWESDSAVH
jgi:hypothetical protein